MAKNSKYDISNFRYNEKWGWLEYKYESGWNLAEEEHEKWYNKNKSKIKKEPRVTKRSTRLQNPGSRPRNIVPNKYRSYFSQNTKFTNRQGHTLKWAKGMTLSGGQNPNYNWGRVNYKDVNGNLRRVGSNQRWGANVNKKNVGSILNGAAEWKRQIQISIHALYVNAENFRVLVGNRALKVFQDSIRYQKFYSNNGKAWSGLSSYTLKKRAKRGTGTHKLREFGDLEQSLTLQENLNPTTTRIFTDIVRANLKHYKKHSIAYAGYHNEGEGHHGPISTPYKRRQFMGHSSYLNPYYDKFLGTMMKRYLFDSVFMVKK